MPASQRKQLGTWYTPPSLVDAVVAALDLDGVVAGCRGRSVRVLDPACGDGRFLHAVAAVLERLGASAELVGVDIDPAAPVFRATADSLGTFRLGDALAMDWPVEQFDVVVGNPPFLNQLSATTSRRGSSRWGGGPYADAAAEFLALAMHVVRPGGRVGLVLPQSLLSARDVAPVRRAVDERAALRWCWWSDARVFDAAVATWAGVWDVGARHDVVRRAHGVDFGAIEPLARVAGDSWSWTMAAAASPLAARADDDTPRLGSIAEITVDFRDVYYGLVDAVSDEGDGPPLVTCGLIDPGRCSWGDRPVRFAKQTWTAPRVDVDRLSPAMRRWADRRAVPKILVANQTRTIEAVHDVDGRWLPSVPVLTCTTDDPERVLDVLDSPAANDWVQHHAAGSGLGAGTVRLTPALLSSIPLP